MCRLKPDITTVKRFLSGHEYHLKTKGMGIQLSKDPISPEIQQNKNHNETNSSSIEGS